MEAGGAGELTESHGRRVRMKKLRGDTARSHPDVRLVTSNLARPRQAAKPDELGMKRRAATAEALGDLTRAQLSS